MSQKSLNFSVLDKHDAELARLGALAERYFIEDPSTCLIKLRQLAEALAQLVASRAGTLGSNDEGFADLLVRLQSEGLVPRDIATLFHQVRKAGNSAAHERSGDHRDALRMLRFSRELSIWYHRTFFDPDFAAGAFVPPRAPQDSSAELREDLEALRLELEVHRASGEITAEQLRAAQALAAQLSEERDIWEQLASEAESDRHALKQRIAELQAMHAGDAPQRMQRFARAAQAAANQLKLSEADTRRLIDQQLQQAGWEADSQRLRYAKGTRPQKGKNLAIAEWPTEHGPADYVLFVGLRPLAVVEAKSRSVDVPSALQQSRRYSRGFKAEGGVELAEVNFGADAEYRVPLVYATNGRPYLRQLSTKSGVWFCDLRSAENLARPLDGWHSPEGLVALLKQDAAEAHAKLANEPFVYGFPLRDYQQLAIQKTEEAIASGQRALLVAMATGTGKTKTCIALVYRLLKTGRFRRVLFLVDRTALGEQALGAFNETRMENLQTFADTFGIRGLEDAKPEASTSVHIATVQGMVARVLGGDEDSPPPTVDQYDCIVVDECHRGYLLDRELSDTELGFRGQEDYISKYRRVLDYFDAVKIGLTATPALHTSEIFGAPVYSYGYREAVIDGYLVDYEPPLQIKTELSSQGIRWRVGEEVMRYMLISGEVELFQAPDDIKLEVDDFNRKVVTESFNRVVCDYLAGELDPAGQRKTLIFCANDAHAELVVHLLKQAFAHRYGSVEDDAVVKITGRADKPSELIRRYRNERLPNVAVTVDLLTTGIDVPRICNLVFLRRISSRILFDQMLGRATRLCPDIEPGVDKESFRVFDAVRIFEALDKLTAMRPVVVNPNIAFEQLESELGSLQDEAALSLTRDQFVAKLQRKRRHLGDETRAQVETLLGAPLEASLKHLRTLPPGELRAWFAQRAGIGRLLDRKGEGEEPSVLVSAHPDRLLEVTPGFGAATRPEDYLHAFAEFIRSHGNEIPALLTVLQRPRELTRKQLRELAIKLDQAGYSEAKLNTAWRAMTNQDIAARIIGHIRRAAIGDPLLPYAERVEHALQKVLSRPPHGRPWTDPQRRWLRSIAEQTKTNGIVDREALDDPDLLFRRDGGGFSRLDRTFDGQLLQTLQAFNDAIWSPSDQPAA